VRAREFGAFGSALGIGMNLRQRKMTEDESQLAGEVLAHGVDDRMREPAMRTFIVAVFDQRDRALAGPRM
jgi:hypothetical protein